MNKQYLCCSSEPLRPSSVPPASPQVAQYLNLQLPILEQVLLRLQEEENREIQRIVCKSVLDRSLRNMKRSFTKPLFMLVDAEALQ